MLAVTESTDYEYFAQLCNISVEHVQTASQISRYYLVTLGNSRKGGFVVIDKSPLSSELHTELQLNGINALNAFKLLIGQLGEKGHNTLTTYAPNDSRVVRLAALIAGFKKTHQDEVYTYYSMSI